MASLAAKTAPSSALFSRRASRRCVVMASASALSQVRVWQQQEQLNRLMRVQLLSRSLPVTS